MKMPRVMRSDTLGWVSGVLELVTVYDGVVLALGFCFVLFCLVSMASAQLVYCCLLVFEVYEKGSVGSLILPSVAFKPVFAMY